MPRAKQPLIWFYVSLGLSHYFTCESASFTFRWSAHSVSWFSCDMAGANECTACIKSLPTKGPILKCSECGNEYHNGKCARVTKKVLAAIPVKSVKTWQCNTCKLHATRQSDTSDERRPAEAEMATSSDSRDSNLDTINVFTAGVAN